MRPSCTELQKRLRFIGDKFQCAVAKIVKRLKSLHSNDVALASV